MPRRAATSDSNSDVPKMVPKKRSRRKVQYSDSEDGSPAKGKKKPAAKLSKEECRAKARELVRLAMANELSRKPLKRDEISKRVLGQHGRSFPQVLKQAQEMLKRTFGMELVELRPKQAVPGSPEVNGKGGAKKGKGKKATEHDEDDDSSDADMPSANVGKKASAGPKSYMLRSRLPEKLLAAASRPRPADADEEGETALRGDLDGADLHRQLEIGQEEYEAWRGDDGSLFDLKRGDQLPTMGFIHILLGIILVNERTCPDGKFRVLLKTLMMRPATEVPHNPATAPALVDKDKMVVDKLLDQLVKQGYLEKHVNKRLQSAHADTSNGDPAVEWTWGARADAEIGEKHVMAFILDTCFPSGTAKDIEEFKTKGAKNIEEAAGSKIRLPTGTKAEE